MATPMGTAITTSAAPQLRLHPLPSRNSPFRPSVPFPRRHPLIASASQTTDAAQIGPSQVAGPAEERFDWYSQWYPVAPVCDLDKRRPHARTVMGMDVVVWWDRNEGAWRVFDDRCPHRLAPLSEGRIDRWGRLQCVYHGWCFNGEGACKFIPQEPPEGQKFHTFNKACAAVYPSFEQNKILWFWPSTDPIFNDISIDKKPPYIAELDDPSFTSQMTVRDIPYGYEVLIENLMDPAHVPYAHYGIMAAGSEDKSKFRDREGGRPLNIKVLSMNKSGFSAKQENGTNKFIAPCIYIANPSSTDSSLKSENIVENQSKNLKRQKQFLLLFICIPVSPGRSRLILSFPRNFAIWMDKIIPRWIFHLGQNLIIDSDLRLIHLQEKKIAEVGPSKWMKACFVPTTSDALVVSFRKWLNMYSNGQIDWGEKYRSFLFSTPPRQQLMDRYWSHVVQCQSCNGALKGLKGLEVVLHAASILSVGIAAVAKQTAQIRTAWVSIAVLCLLMSRWLSHFVYKNFYYHDYDHAFR